MNLETLHTKHKEIVRSLYAKAAPDFDAAPTILMDTAGVLAVIVLAGSDNPLDAAKAAVAGQSPDAVSFMSPVWRKDLQGNRIGEGVMLLTESPLEQHTTMFEVSRDPLRLNELDIPEEASTIARVSLLYHPTTHTTEQ